jgi:hypothetical protein
MLRGFGAEGSAVPSGLGRKEKGHPEPSDEMNRWAINGRPYGALGVFGWPLSGQCQGMEDAKILGIIDLSAMSAMSALK